MGRKRLHPNEKRKRLSITLPKKLICELKKDRLNISRMVEKYLEDYLNNKEK